VGARSSRFQFGRGPHIIAAMSARRHDPVKRALLLSAVLGVLLLAVVGTVGVVVLRGIAVDRAMENARQLTALSARIVQPRVENGLVSGDAESTAKIATIVSDAVLHPPVVAVKIWSPEGLVVYANDVGLIGRRVPSSAELFHQVAPNVVLTRITDASTADIPDIPESTRVLVSYVRLRTPGGTPLLLETDQRFSTVADSQRRLLTDFAPVLVVALVAFAVLLVPLVLGLARRVRRAGDEREQLLLRAIDASGQERRRIARDIHDGPVQELSGLAMRLSAEAERASEPEATAAFRDAAAAVRGSVRTLRSAIFGIYPPNVRAAGLGPALSDLTAHLSNEGLQLDLDVRDPQGYGPEVDGLLFRACREAIRNVEAHAGARHVAVSVFRRNGRAVLEVLDDGRGVREEEVSRAAADGHFGLQLLRDVVRDSNGDVEVHAEEDGGTLVHVEVPVR
jgi:two-component system NarL family sensor kinase